MTMTAAHQVSLSPPTSSCVDDSGRQRGPPPVVESSASPSVVNATGELFPAGLGSSHYELPFALLTLGTLIKQQLDSTLIRALTIATRPTASHTSHPCQKGAGIMVNSFKCILLSIVYLPFLLDALKTLLPLPLFLPSLSWILVYSVLCYPASTWKTEYIDSCTSHLGPHHCALTPAPAATPASLAGAPGT